MKQRLLGIAALLTIGALMAGVPWLFIFVAMRARIRFDLTTVEGWWQAVTVRDDGSLLVWIGLVIGAVAWASLAVALIVEATSRARHVTVPRLRGLGLPQAIAHALVAAAIGAVLATNTVTTGGLQALANPGPVPVDTSGTPSRTPSAPTTQPNPNDDRRNDAGDDERDDADHYVVKKGDTLWDIADEHLGDPFAYPEIYEASKDTVQPDGRRLVDPDLIYPGWELTIPDYELEKPVKPRRVAVPDTPSSRSETPTATPTPASTSPQTAPTARPVMSATPVTDAEPAEPYADVDDSESTDEAAPLPWILTGLTGAGALLAGGLWLRLRRRRAVQFRFRRPGRTIAVPDEPALVTVERTLRHQGDVTSDLVDRIAQTTQRLAATLHTASQPIPALLGVDVTEEHLTYRFTEPVDLPEPWEPGSDRRAWRIDTGTDPDLIGPWDEQNEPVWPTLVTLGQDDHGWRMLNLETLGVITLTGDQAGTEDLVRYWLTELSVAHWGRDLEIARGDLFAELAPLIRVDFWRAHPNGRIAALLERAERNRACLADEGLTSMDAGRAAQAGPELWQPRVLITAADEDGLDQLAECITSHPVATGITNIRLGGSSLDGGIEIHLTTEGRVRVPALGLDLVANGITPDEAAGCAALVAPATVSDAPVPDAPEPAAGWQQHADAAGHLHADLTLPRGALGAVDATSLLPDPDVVYVTQTANTVYDLAELAPLVPAETTALVKESDPTLDQDLADWRADSIDRPRLSVLGPVRVRLGRSGDPMAGLNRVPYLTEIVAYLATRPHGATADELSDALGVKAARVRVDLHNLRTRLGPNPRTGRPYLPDARKNAEAGLRAVGVYLIEDLLSDADLFRRLRLRGEASGVHGVDDLSEALRLVTGAPYEQLRSRGGLWLANSRDDQHLLVGIIDIAHLLTTHALAGGDLQRARGAAELAHAVAPHEEVPRLDLAAIAEDEGSLAEAHRIAHEGGDWLDGTGDGPLDLSQRADAILRAHRWLERRDCVG